MSEVQEGTVRAGARAPRALWGVLLWTAGFIALNLVRIWAADRGWGGEPQLFTASDALIAAAPLVIWLVLIRFWDKVTLPGGMSFEHRVRARIEQSLQGIERLRAVELDPANAERIESAETTAVSITVDPEAGLPDLEWFVSKDEKGVRNCNWEHVRCVVLQRRDGTFFGAMGPRRLRRLLVESAPEFLASLRSEEPEAFEGVYRDVQVRVRADESKSAVVKKLARHPDFEWLPVTENDRFVGVVDPLVVALELLGDLAEVVSN